MTKWADVSVDLKTVVAWLAAAFAAGGIYYGITAKLEGQRETMAALRAEVATLHTQQAAMDRALVELLVELRTREVIRDGRDE